jgi:hypothetical protein
VRSPRRISAASYSDQFVTRYLAFGILWRRLALNFYGMDRSIHQTRYPLPYHPAATAHLLGASPLHVAITRHAEQNELRLVAYSCTKALEA